MYYVIRNLDTGLFAAKPGEQSYTDKFLDVRLYRNKEEAERNCCGNERAYALSGGILFIEGHGGGAQ